MGRLGTGIWAIALVAGLGVVSAGAASAASGASGIASSRIVIGPAQSIQKAVNNARPGTTIVLRRGVYHQSVLIRKDGITLLGSGERGTVLRPPRRAPHNSCTAAFGETGICVLALKVGPKGRVLRAVRHVTISKLSVVGFPANGVFGYGTVRLKVTRVAARNDGDYGISRFNSTRTQFTNDIATGNHEAGFYVGDSPDADTVVSNDWAAGNQFGIFVRHARQVLVWRNHLTGNCQGILVLDDGQRGGAGTATIKANVVIRNNKFCRKHGDTPINLKGGGILLLGATKTLVLGNLVNGNVGKQLNSGGIVVVSAHKLTHGRNPDFDTITGNHAHHNGPADLIWDGTGKDVKFIGNVCTTSIPPGLCT